jgi:hypothetical protein
MAEKEGNRIVSVGGLVTRVEREAAQTSPAVALEEWIKIFPIRMMRKLQFSLPEGLPDAAALLQFFGVSSPEAWQEKWNGYAVAYRQTQKFDAHRQAVAAWVREAELIASRIELADFNERKLRTSVDELRRQTREDIQAGLTQAQMICSKVGVALVMVPELPGTRLSGCARWLDHTHALVGLTTRYKKDDQIWFTFFHEIGHILLHRDRRLFVLDNADEYLSDTVVDPDMAKYEEEANRFARDTLIPPDALAEFLRHHGETLTNDEIHDFADSIGVGPGIVVGRLQHAGILKWHQGNKLKQTVDWGFVQED